MGVSKITYLKDKRIKGRVWEPTAGCSECSPACDECWARGVTARLAANPRLRGLDGRNPYAGLVGPDGKWTGKVCFFPERLREPIRRQTPTVYLVCSRSDLFHLAVLPGCQEVIFWHMAGVPRHRFLLLTKRPQIMADVVTRLYNSGVPENIWLGATVWDQGSADAALCILSDLAGRGWHTWVSYEPMLGPVNWRSMRIAWWRCPECGQAVDPDDFHRLGNEIFCADDHWGEADGCTNEVPLPIGGRWLNWLVVGCESGPKRRNCPEQWEWAWEAIRAASGAGVPVYLKQLPAVAPPLPGSRIPVVGCVLERPELDGRQWLQYPKGWPGVEV